MKHEQETQATDTDLQLKYFLKQFYTKEINNMPQIP